MKNTVLILFLFISSVALSQKSAKEKKGDKYFHYYSFNSAILKYNSVSNLTVDGQRKLAESYRNIGNYDLCEKVYSQFITSSGAISDDYFNFSYVLRLNGKYEESDVWMNKLAESYPDDLRVKSFKNNISKFGQLLKDEGRYGIVNLEVNTDHQEFGTAFYLDQLVYASTREDIKPVKHIYNWNQRPFLDIYFADLQNDQMLNPRQFSKKLNNEMHEGPASFTADGKLMAFTCNNYKSKSSDKTIKLQIFFAEKDDNGEWEKLIPFKLNDPEYSVAFPALSKDGSYMYFASDMPGGFGGVDLYRIERNSDGTWGDPVNLGNTVNTEANEMFPFFHESQNLLFFASNGHLGLGGLDIFVSPVNKDKQFTKVINLGYPMNTRFDDFAFILNEQTTKGYFSSNREGGKGDDDIYMFEMLKPFSFGKTIKGVAKDTKGKILSGVKIELKDEEGNIVNTFVTSENGIFEFIAEPDRTYIIEAIANNYNKNSLTLSTNTNDDIVNGDIKLEQKSALLFVVSDAATKEVLKGVKIQVQDLSEGLKYENERESGSFKLSIPDKKVGQKISYIIRLEKEGYLNKNLVFTYTISDPGDIYVHEQMDLSLSKLEVGVDLAKMINLKPIYFDLSKYNIRKDAAEELDKIVKILKDYPAMEIEIGSHTDCRSSAQFNAKLSENRAKSSMEYIQKRISNPERVTGKGYGESKLKNDCACEGSVKSTCTEEQHQENRRTEFIILKFE
ncbi:MAG: OmpA family protein [Cytophagaceae bacterium]